SGFPSASIPDGANLEAGGVVGGGISGGSFPSGDTGMVPSPVETALAAVPGLVNPIHPAALANGPTSGPGTSGGTGTPTDAQPDLKQLAQSYGHLPLQFEPNEGQTDSRVKFLSRGAGYELFLTSTEAVLALSKSTALAANPKFGQPFDHPAQDIVPPEMNVLRMRWVGANPNAQISGLGQLPGISNYFIGNDPDKWVTDVPTYGEVAYKDLYPGIDLLYYGNNRRQIEYDFIVAPGVD